MSTFSAASDATPETNGSGQMFDRIAKRYDRLNRIMSFGIDRRWRRKLVAALGDLSAADEVLDVATGTADVALAIAKRTEASVVGLDPSTGMLDVGRAKVTKRVLDDRVSLVEGDGQDLPFEDDRFAGAVISFGIRNVPDRDACLREMARTVRPGGRVIVLELSEPTKRGPIGAAARFHVHHVVPRLGAWLSGDKEYRYLQQSVAAFPPAADFVEQMENAGLNAVSATALTFGVAHLYVGTVA